MGEIWKPIEGFEGFYEISNEGRIKNSRRNKILRVGYDSDGYPHYTFSKNGKRKTYTIHKLVAIHFIDNPFGYKCINHKDENKQTIALKILSGVRFFITTITEQKIIERLKKLANQLFR